MLKMDATTTSKTVGAACWAVVILLLAAVPASVGAVYAGGFPLG